MAAAYERESRRQQREQARSVAAYNRLVAQNEREQLRQIKQHEMAMRRAEREREKAERERERAAKLQAKMQEQQRVESEISQIEDDNFLWTNVHSFIDKIVSIEEVNETIAKCDYEQQYNVEDGFFEKKRPTDYSAKQKAQSEADKLFDIEKVQKEYFEANKKLVDLVFDEVEPTIEGITEELTLEAKASISAFLPWKQSKLRKAYVAEHLDDRYRSAHEEWQSKKEEYESQKETLEQEVSQKEKSVNKTKQSKKDYISKRVNELCTLEIREWEKEREDFYDSFRNSLQSVIDGDKDYIVAAISSLFPDDELPMEYFVDFTYEEEKGKVMVDLDLPEIEDIPDRKIILTPTGKKSIRLKGQTDLRSDYAHCVFGLAMYVAHTIFNVSLKIQEVEISGYTQRKEANSAVATDQYVFVVDFTRDLFAEIDFNRLSSMQIMDFFKRHFNMTKSFDMKQIDLATAYDKMDAFVPADYQSFIASLPPEKEPQETLQRQSSQFSGNSTSVKYVDDSPIETFEKASNFMRRLYLFIDKLSRDSGVNRHAENLKDVHIRWTSGNYTGDADTNTYRGKLFFCAMLDMYRSLKKMRINVSDFSPANYPFALMMIKIYMKSEIQYSDLAKYEQTYKPYCDMLQKMDTGIFTPEHFYLLGEILYDYSDNSWYSQYLGLMFNLREIVRDSIQSSDRKRHYVDDFENFLKGIFPYYDNNTTSNSSNDVDMQHLDPLFEDAARIIVINQSGSTSLIQRKFGIGYNRAGRLMDQLEKAGVVGIAMGSKPREVLIQDEMSLNNLLKSFR